MSDDEQPRSVPRTTAPLIWPNVFNLPTTMAPGTTSAPTTTVTTITAPITSTGAATAGLPLVTAPAMIATPASGAPPPSAPHTGGPKGLPKPNIDAFKEGGLLSFAEYRLRWELYFEYAEVTNEDKKKSIFVNNVDSSMFAKIHNTCLPSTIPQTPLVSIMDKLAELYKESKVSVHVHRNVFNTRFQGPDESFADFYTDLCRTADLCKWTARDENLVSRVIAGMKSDRVKQQLLAEEESKLSLEYVKSRNFAEEQAESSAKRLSAVGGGEVNRVGAFKKPHRGPTSDRQKTSPCFVCGQKGHWRNECKYKNPQCYKCKKNGHIAPACKEKKGNEYKKKEGKTNFVKNQEYDEEEEENAINYLLKMSDVESHVPAKQMNINLNGQPLKMEIDSGASFSLIGYDTYKKYFPEGSELLSTSVKMQAWGQAKYLKPLGAVPVSLRLEGDAAPRKLRLLVMRTSGPALVGRNWFEALDIDVSTPKVRLNRVAAVPAGFEEFAEVFEDKLGCFNGEPIHLEMKENFRPVQRPPRSVPFALREAAGKALDKLVKAGVLEPVDASDWATPVVVVEKQDGSVRICADYSSTVNPQTKKADYPPDEFDRLISSIGNGFHFTKIDLADAYLQFRVDEEAAEMLTINTLKGRFKFKRLPPGLSVAPGVFLRKVQALFAHLKNVFVYFDDILIYAKDKKELQKITAQVLQILKDKNLKVKLQKCLFDVSEVEYLGYNLTSKGVKPTDSKLAAIEQMPPPENVDQLRSYLGFVNYYNRFVPSKSQIFQPLFRLLQQDVPFEWTEDCQKAMDEVKRALTTAPALTYYDVTRPLRLACDGSQKGLGAVLSHVDSDGHEVPIMHISRSLKKAERNYSQVENEALAVTWAVKKLKKFLWGRRFEIVTDHLPLLRIFNPEKCIPEMLPGKIKRYALFLREFLYVITHKAGKDHSNADCLSRLPLPDCEGEDELFGDLKIAFLDFVGPEKVVSAEDLKRETAKDVELEAVRQTLLHGRPKYTLGDAFLPFKRRWESMSVANGVVLFAERAVVPKSLQAKVTKQLHQNHFGEARMKSAARGVVWWPGMDDDLTREAKSCVPCLSANNAPAKLPTLPWSKPLAPWSRVHLDFGETQRGKTFLIAVDASTGWLEAEPTKGMGSAETIKICRTLCRRLGLCDAFVCDNGPAFRSAEFQEFCARNHIKLIFAPPYSPATNGLAERGVQTVKNFLKKTAAQDWDAQLDSYILGHNTTPSPDTQISPAEKMMGRRLKTLLSKMHPAELPLTKRIERDANVVAALPTETPKNLQMGSPVLYRLFVNNRVTWQPGTVTCILGPRRVEIERPDAIKITRHVDQVKPVLQPDDPRGRTLRSTNAEKLEDTPDKNNIPGTRPKRQTRRPERYR
jgi:hypothetical protein